MTICILAQFRSFVHRLWFCWRRDYGQLVMLKKKERKKERERERKKRRSAECLRSSVWEKQISLSIPSLIQRVINSLSPLNTPLNFIIKYYSQLPCKVSKIKKKQKTKALGGLQLIWSNCLKFHSRREMN